METSERALCAAVIAITLIAIATRVQSSPPDIGETPIETSSPIAEQSAWQLVSPARGTTRHAERFTSPAETPATPIVNEEASPRNAPAYDEEDPVILEDDGQRYGPEVDVAIEPLQAETWTDRLPLMSWEMTDQQVFNEMVAIMGPEERGAFRVLWAQLSEDERAGLLGAARLALITP